MEPTIGQLGLCGPADEPEDLCPGSAPGPCRDPHCHDRTPPDDLKSNEKCAPYSPPAAVCGNGADGCPPQCCKAKSVEELGEEIAAAVQKAREERTIELTDPHAMAALEAIVNDFADAQEVRTTSTGRRCGLPEDESDPNIRAAVQQAYDALKAGRALLAVDEQQVRDGWSWQPARPADKPVVVEESWSEEAQRIVNGARRGAYGTPERNFERIALLWTAFLEGRPDRNAAITPQETALMVMLLKVARLLESPRHRDSGVDIIGYALCIENLWASQDAAAAQRSADVD